MVIIKYIIDDDDLRVPGFQFMPVRTGSMIFSRKK